MKKFIIIVCSLVALVLLFDYLYFHRGMYVYATLVVCDKCLFGTIECHSVTLCTFAKFCNIIESENHIL